MPMLTSATPRAVPRRINNVLRSKPSEGLAAGEAGARSRGIAFAGERGGPSLSGGVVVVVALAFGVFRGGAGRGAAAFALCWLRELLGATRRVVDGAPRDVLGATRRVVDGVLLGALGATRRVDGRVSTLGFVRVTSGRSGATRGGSSGAGVAPSATPGTAAISSTLSTTPSGPRRPPVVVASEAAEGSARGILLNT
jgi:hypothetical protein